LAAPSVLFLDEPTTGLDPTARAALWDIVDELTASGTTVVLTTQYLEEVDRLADDIVVLDHGRVAARGTPAELKRIVGGKVVSATIPVGDVDRLPQAPDTQVQAGPGTLTVTYGAVDADAATALVAHFAVAGVTVHDLDIASPRLDDVFTHLTPAGARS
jgi:ABC-2 type transport system ATP-binding protein